MVEFFHDSAKIMQAYLCICCSKIWFFVRFALTLTYGFRYSHSKMFKYYLAFYSLIRIFVPVFQRKHIFFCSIPTETATSKGFIMSKTIAIEAVQKCAVFFVLAIVGCCRPRLGYKGAALLRVYTD